MTSFIAKQVGKRIFGETLANSFGAKVRRALSPTQLRIEPAGD